MAMTMGKNGLDLVKSFEGLYLNAYKCPAGVWTIGYGHTGKVDGAAICSGMRITEAKANKLLAADMAEFEKAVTSLVKVKLNQNQFDALVSFAFNCGSGNLKSSTLLKYLNAGKYEDAADQFLVWNKAAGKVLAGLTRRREAERKLFLTPVAKKSLYTFKKFVKQLEVAAGMKKTGVASEALLNKLPNLSADTKKSAFIKPLKKILKKKGYTISKVNLKWDDDLGVAVKKFKKANNMDSTSKSVGKAFWKKILKIKK